MRHISIKHLSKGPGSLAMTVVLLGVLLAACGRAVSTQSVIKPKQPGDVVVTVRVPKLPVSATVAGQSALSTSGTPGNMINENLIGVDGPGPAGAVAGMKEIGVHWVRTDASLQSTYNGQPVYNCSTGAWNPVLLDKNIQRIHAEGAQPLVIVDYTPICLATLPYATANPNYSPPDIGADAQKWSALVTQMAYHEITTEGVRAFEIWNEPDWIFWDGQPKLTSYLTLYKITAQALEAGAQKANVKIEVGGPAMADVTTKPDLSFLLPLAELAVRDHLPLNFISWHLYANDPYSGPSPSDPGGMCFQKGPVVPAPPGEIPSSGVPTSGTLPNETFPLKPPDTVPCWYKPNISASYYGTSIRQVRAVLTKFPSLHPKLWIDEWNVGAEYDARQSTSYGAAFAAAVLQSVQNAGGSRMCFYNTSDGNSEYTGSGLLYSNLSPKPVWYTMLFWHKLAGKIVPAKVENGTMNLTQLPEYRSYGHVLVPFKGNVGVIASVADTSATKVHVLMYNLAPYDPTGIYGTTDPNPWDRKVVLNINQPSHGYHWNVSVRMVDALHNGTVLQTGKPGHLGKSTQREKGAQRSVRVTLPGESVALVTFTLSRN